MPDNLPLSQRRLSPTDFSQYLRLDRCERYLRLRMVEREHKTGFLEAFGVEPQNPPKVLAAGGEAFEAEIVRGLRASNVILTLDEALTTLEPGQAGVVLQPRLEATLGNWRVTGDADLIRLERAPGGEWEALIVDVKSSETPKVEHRLQVAFYAALLEKTHGISGARLAVLYRGPSDPDGANAAHRQDCLAWLGIDAGYLEVIDDPDSYRAEVTALVEGPNALADRLAEKPFASLFFALGTKCDACRYGEFCHKRVHLDNDLSLVPYLSARDKRALLAADVKTASDLATLKDLDGAALKIAEGREETVKHLATTSVGPRLDELVLRARKARGVELPTLPFLPGKGHSTLPVSAPELHPNLVRLFLDVQQDPVEKRAYLAGARIVAHENGVPVRAENVVHSLKSPPKSPDDEAKLFSAWAVDVLACVARLAAPDENGELRAPLHLIFWEDYGQTLLLDALARNFGAMAAAAPALYGLLTQLAAYDSPAATFLSEEIRERKNYPILCPSLHAVASYLKFDWGDDLKRAFYRGVFDAGGTLEDGSRYARRPRHSSQIPPEYIYGVWHPSPASFLGTPFPAAGKGDGGMGAFAEKRLEAIQFVADSLPTNDKTTKTLFDLSGLATASAPETTLADALGEFLTLERHAFLTGWRDTRQLAPERRALAGETLLVRYVEEDQDEGVAEQNRECARRKPLQDAWREANPKKQLRGADRDELHWSLEGATLRLRLEWDGIEGDPATVLGLLDLKEGDSVVLSPRWSVDERLPEAERAPFTPTPKQLLYAVRARLTKLPTLENPHAVISLGGGMGSLAGFTFGAFVRPLEADAVYTLDPSPDDIFGYWHHKVIDALKNLEATGQTARHALYEWLRLSPSPPGPLSQASPMGEGERGTSGSEIPPPPRSGEAWEGAGGGKTFLAGLDAFHAAGHFHDLEAGKRDYIGSFHDEKILLVQGPPGTGKSYSTALAVLARIQEALRAEKPCRVFLSCKTHSATDVLLRGVAEGIRMLEDLRQKDPALWDAHFDVRLLDLPLIRLEKGTNLPGEVRILPADAKETLEELAGSAALVVGATPGGIYKLVKKKLIGTNLAEWLVLDEASQMSLPEALMAALPLAPGGQVIVVGDPRQMPPIVQHEWEGERRQTFQQFPAYRSLYQTLAERGVKAVRFEESFRLHRTLAKFLRDEIYIHDGIDYRSKRTSVLDEVLCDDPLAAAALNPRYPLVVLVHDEAASQTRNAVEESLIAPILAALEGANLGVVVPHRAQRAALKLAYPSLENSIDTVERYQGDERDAILVSAVESDPEFVRAAAAFLLDPRRLNVALSRAKKKLILVASRTIFDLLPTDDALFASARFWKNLLRRACTEKLWEGERDGVKVTVWGASAE